MIELRFKDGPMKGHTENRRHAAWQVTFDVDDAKHGPCEDVYRATGSGYQAATYHFFGRRRRIRGESKWVLGGT